MICLQRYPTGDVLLDHLVEFLAGRLPQFFGPAPRAYDDRPSLAENWWVEDRLAEGRTFPGFATTQDGLRACYRWALNRNVETGNILFVSAEDAADLLLQQITELFPSLFGQAARLAPGARP